MAQGKSKYSGSWCGTTEALMHYTLARILTLTQTKMQNVQTKVILHYRSGREHGGSKGPLN